MTSLTLVRHGIAHPHGTPEFSEDDRPLTPKGRRRMVQVARGLKVLRVRPDRLISSPLPRALQTAEILADRLGLRDRLERDDALRADRSAASIRDWLDGQAGESVMIVGHNPSFSELLTVLPLGQDAPPIGDLKKGGAAHFEVTGPGSYRLDWVAPPRLLRLLGE